MTDIAGKPASLPVMRSEFLPRMLGGAEYVVIPALAVVAALLLFSVFLILVGKSPLTFVELIWTGAFGSGFSWRNTLQRASPLILTALAVAVPARLGLTMIGGEGALVLSGFAAAAIAVPFVGSGVSAVLVMPLMALAAMVVGGLWVGLAGYLS